MKAAKAINIIILTRQVCLQICKLKKNPRMELKLIRAKAQLF